MKRPGLNFSKKSLFKRPGPSQKKNQHTVLQRVPALRVFWDLEKTVLHETRVSGTVLLDSLNAIFPH